MMKRTIPDIDLDIGATRRAIQILMVNLEALVEERQRRSNLLDFLNDDDQKCGNCGGKLEKRKNKRRTAGWRCRECQKEQVK